MGTGFVHTCVYRSTALVEVAENLALSNIRIQKDMAKYCTRNLG